MSDVQVVILAAGYGSRLGRPLPKPLTPLADGRTIMGQQIANLRAGLDSPRITAVVGFKMDAIMEAFPDISYAYNERYDQTNTGKSLLRALALSGPGGVLWLNGDVVFDPRILGVLAPVMAAEQSFVAVNTAEVDDEEIKYTVDSAGFIVELSKTVIGGLGEAVGINYIGAADKALLIKHLDACADNDYFERGLETAIAAGGLRVLPVDITEFYAVEVDFEADLDEANKAQEN
ncbi:MAG: phosphocholine cytidylyltransferase family protein [Sporichthyaceae bacterium]